MMIRNLGVKVSKAIPHSLSSSENNTISQASMEKTNQDCHDLSQADSLSDILMCAVMQNFTYDVPDDIEMHASLICNICKPHLG